MLDLNAAHRLETVVLEATTPPKRRGRGRNRGDEDAEVEVDAALLQEMKRIVRKSDDLIARSYDLLMERMRKKNATVRLLTLEIVHALAVRSKAFRGKLIDDLSEFLQLAAAHQVGTSLPPPKQVGERLRARALEVLRDWSARFGAHYQTLGHSERYLSNLFASTRFQRMNGEEGSRGRDAAGRDRDRIQSALHDKFLELLRCMPELKQDTLSLVREIEACLEVLSQMAARDEADADASGSDDGLAIYESEGLALYGQDSPDHAPAEGGSATELLIQLRDLLQVRARAPSPPLSPPLSCSSTPPNPTSANSLRRSFRSMLWVGADGRVRRALIHSL